MCSGVSQGVSQKTKQDTGGNALRYLLKWRLPVHSLSQVIHLSWTSASVAVIGLHLLIRTNTSLLEHLLYKKNKHFIHRAIVKVNMYLMATLGKIILNGLIEHLAK